MDDQGRPRGTRAVGGRLGVFRADCQLPERRRILAGAGEIRRNDQVGSDRGRRGGRQSRSAAVRLRASAAGWQAEDCLVLSRREGKNPRVRNAVRRHGASPASSPPARRTMRGMAATGVVPGAPSRVLAPAPAAALACGLFFTPPISNAIDWITRMVTSLVPANLGDLGFVSPAQGQPAALTPAQSDALNAYNRA